MKRLLLLVSAFVLTVGLAGCSLFGGGDDTGITTVTINGLENQTAYTETVVDLLDGVTVTADDGASYTDLLDVDSDNCEVTAAGTVTATNPVVCTVTFTAVVEGIVARQSITVTFENEPIVVDPDAPLVKGWYFDSDADLTGWGVFTDGGGVFNSDGIEDGAWKLDVTTSTNSYGVRKDFMGVPIEANETYTVTFMAKSSVADKKIHVQMGELVPAPTYFVDFMPGQDQYFTLTTEWAEYTFSFEMGDAANANGGILFSFGDMEGSVGINAVIYLDDIEIRGGSGEDTVGPKIDGAADVNLLLNDTFDVNAGVTAADLVDGDLTSSIVVGGDTLDTATAGTYEVTYTVSDEAGNETVVTRTITVYDFSTAPTMAQWTFGTDTDLLGWSFDNSVKAISGAIDAGALKVTYTNGGNTWEPRFYNQGLPFENGETYMVSFKAKSDVAGKIIHLQTGELLSADPWFTNFKTTTDIAELTTEWQTFFYIFEMSIDNENGGLLFELGNYGSSVDISGNIWIDDVKIVGGSGTDTLGPQIIGADDVVLEVGETFTATDGVVAVDLTDGDLTSSIVVTGDTVDTATAGEYELTYTVEDAAGNETVVTRTVTVIAVVLDDNNDEMFDIFDQTTVLTDDDTMDWWLSNITDGEEGDAEYKEATLVASTRNGVLSILHDKGDFDSISTNNLWDAIVFYQSLNLLEGVDYMITFEAKTDLAGNDANSFLLKLENGAWSTEKFFVLTNEFADYSITFNYGGDTTLDALLMFMVGGIEQTITIQNLEIYIDVAEAETPNAPILDAPAELNILSSETINLLDYITGEDLEDGVLTFDATNITVAGPGDATTFDSTVAGEWTITYTYTDTDDNETSVDMIVTVYNFTTQPTLGEWDFEDTADLTPWTFDAQGASITGTIFTEGENDVLQVVFTAGGQPYQPRFFIQNVPFEQDATYLVSFKAKADVAGKIMRLQAGELLSADPWFTAFTSETDLEYVELTTEWVTYYYIFDMALNNQNGGILFELGNYLDSVDLDGTIWIDDIQIIGGSGVDSTPPTITGATDVTLEVGDTFVDTDGVTAYDLKDGDLTASIVISGDTVDTNTGGTYVVTYTVTDAAGNTTSVDRTITVISVVADSNNSDMLDIFTTDTALVRDEDTSDWYYIFNSGSPVMSVSTTSGVMTIAHTFDGTNAINSDPWESIVFYQALKLINGVEYKLVFDAKTDIASNTADSFLLKLENGAWATQQFYALTDTIDTYELTFTYSGDTTLDGLLMFMVGGIDQTITIENLQLMISIEGSNLTNSPVVSGTPEVVINNGDAFDPLTGVTAIDIEDGELTLDSSNVTVLGPNSETVFDNTVDGIWTFTYTVTDSDMNETVITREVSVMSMVFNPTTLVANGTFDTDVTGWAQWSQSGGATLSHNTDELLFTYDSVGGDFWTNQLFYDGITFEYGKTYKLVFDAYGDAAREFRVAIYDGTNKLEPGLLNLTDTSQTFEYVFTYTLGATSKIEITLGAMGNGNDAGTEFHLDNVVIEELQQDAVLMNGSFEATAWSSYVAWDQGANAAITYPDGTVELDIAAVGNNNWDIQLFQEGLTLVNGTQYRITFEAMTTVARDVNVKLITGTQEYVATVMLDGTLTTYTVDFTANADETAKLSIELGNALYGITTAPASVVTFESIYVEEYDGSAVVADTNQITNPTFEEILYWGNWLDVFYYSGPTQADVNFTAINGEAIIDIIDAGGAGWAVQFNQPLTVEVGTEYTVEFVMYADATRTITANVGYDDPFVTLGELVDQEITMTPTMYSFTFTAVDTGGLDTLIGFQFGGDTTNVYIEDVYVYVNYN